jgi:hypothetical protein
MSSEHIILADSIKKVHQQLRRDIKHSTIYDIMIENLLFFLLGPEAVESIWKTHVANIDKLNEYAQSMRQLAEHHWAGKAHGQTRLTWCYETIKDYFYGNGTSGLERKRARDQRKQISTHICENCQTRIQ